MTQRRFTADAEPLEARLAGRLAAGLGIQAAGLPHDISERLRVAREQAVSRARQARQLASAGSPVLAGLNANGEATLGRGSPWWLKMASGVPLFVLLAGLLLIQHWTEHEQVLAAAEIDAMLLADDLPPDAYADPGFGEYLKSPNP